MLGTGTTQVAKFDGFDTFPHFTDPTHPNCFACNSKKLIVRPLVANNEFTLVPATTRLDSGLFVVIPQCWLVFPRYHVTSFMQLPATWTSSVQCAVWHLGIESPFCISSNWGKAAGQTSEHAHDWVIGRGFGEEGLLSENTGLATIIDRIKQYNIILP